MKEKEIRIKGFTTDIRSTVDLSLVVGLYGIQGSGKTRFIATCPDPIGVIPLDRKTRYTIAKDAEALGKTVVMPEEDFIRHAKPMELMSMKDSDAKQYYKAHTENVMEAAYKLAAHPDIRTIAVDSFSQFSEDLLFKHYGRTWRIMPRDRGPYNQDIIDFINAVSRKHLILTHKSAEIWTNTVNSKGEEVGQPTGKFKQKGFGDLGYHCTVLVEMKKNLNWAANGAGKIEWKYSMDLKDCQANPELEGPQGKDALTDEFISFANLASLVYPDADTGQWL